MASGSEKTENAALDPCEEGRLAVKNFNKKVHMLMSNIPEDLKEMYDNLEFAQNDVIIAGYFKSGTNWMEQICHQIKMRGNDESFGELTDEVPLFDIFGPIGGGDLSANQKGPFKIFKTHYAFDQLPECTKNAKFVVIFREPHNTFASQVQWEPHFFCDMVPQAHNITVENFYFERIAHPESKYPTFWWKYMESWLINHKQVNSIIVFYEELVRDFSSQLDRIAKFLDVSLTQEEKERVKYLSSFDYMKANDTKFNLHSIRRNAHKAIKELNSSEEALKNIPVFVSKGAKRKGKEELTESVKEDMKRKWEENIEAKFGYKDYEEMAQSIKEQVDQI